MAKYVFNASPTVAKVVLGAQTWDIPPGKSSFKELSDRWEEEMRTRGTTLGLVLAEKQISIEQIIKHGAAGQNLSLAFGYDKPEDLEE